MGFWGFILRHPIGALVGAVGAFLTIGGLVSDAYSFYQFGLPPLVWSAIGALIFMSAIVGTLYRFEQRHGAGDVAPRRRRGSGGELEQLRKLGYDALELASDLRSYLGRAYEYGLGPPSGPIPAQLSAQIGPMAFKFGKLGVTIPGITAPIEDGRRAELIMLFCEHVGRIMTTDGLNAEEIKGGITAVTKQMPSQ